MLVKKFSFAPKQAKNPIVQVIDIVIILTICSNDICECALWHHSHYYSTRKLTVSFSDTLKPLIMSLDTPAMNTTGHINWVFWKSTYSQMSRVITSPNSIITAIVNSDEYQQSPLMDKLEYILYVEE